jgi:hypothetical protein
MSLVSWPITITPEFVTVAPNQPVPVAVTIAIPERDTVGIVMSAWVYALPVTRDTPPARATLSTTVTTAWVVERPVPTSTELYGRAQCMDDLSGFYVIGGKDSFGEPLSDMYYFNVNEGWKQLPSLPERKMGLASVCYGGKIYAAGGAPGLLRSFYIYDIATDQWSEGPPLPRRMVWGAAIGAWDGKLYLVGGSPWDYTPSSQVNIFDIATQKWLTYGGLRNPVAVTMAGYVQAGPYLYLIGGSVGAAINTPVTQRFDMGTKQWSRGPDLNLGRALSAVGITQTRLYVQGGIVGGNTPVDKIEVLYFGDWPGGSWFTLNDPLPAPTGGGAGYCTPHHDHFDVWITGGSSESSDGLLATNSNLCRHTDACYDYPDPWEETK